MIADTLKRGVGAGLVAGLAYGLYMALVGNPLTAYVHDAGHGHDHSHDHGHAVSETTNAIVSAGSGILWAVFLGGVFALAYYLFEPALPGGGHLKAYVLAGAGFLTVSGIPWLALPPAAPGAENLYGVEARLGLYGSLVVLGAVTVGVALLIVSRLADRHLAVRTAAAVTPILGVGLAVTVATPTVVSHPDLSSELVVTYQALAVFTQAGLWLVIAATFSWLEDRHRTQTTNHRVANTTSHT